MENSTEAFLTYLADQRGFTANTMAAYRNDLNQFVTFLSANEHDPDWASVKATDINAFIGIMREQAYATSTVARKVAAVKSFFHFLSTQGRIKSDPTRNLESPRVNKYLPKAMSVTEVHELLDQPAKQQSLENVRDQAMLELLYATGLRVSELVALNLEDVELKGEGRGVVRCVGKNGRARLIPLTSRGSYDALAAYVTVGRPHLAAVAKEEQPALFLNHRGQRLTRQGFWLILKSYASAAGIANITPHTLRHSFAAHKLKGGANLRDVQQLLGHASISTTQVYIHLNKDNVS